MNFFGPPNDERALAIRRDVYMRRLFRMLEFGAVLATPFLAEARLRFEFISASREALRRAGRAA